MYFRLPLSTSPSPFPRPSSAHNSSARYPLSSPPTPHATVCTQNSSATRRDSHSSDAKTARALLSRVASSPVVPQTGSISPRLQPSSPLSSEKQQHHHRHHHHHTQHEHEASSPTSGDRSSMVASMERRWSDGWAGHQQREGYVSFPDFEKYFPDEEVGRQQAETYARHHAAAAAQ